MDTAINTSTGRLRALPSLVLHFLALCALCMGASGRTDEQTAGQWTADNKRVRQTEKLTDKQRYNREMTDG